MIYSVKENFNKVKQYKYLFIIILIFLLFIFTISKYNVLFRCLIPLSIFLIISMAILIEKK